MTKIILLSIFGTIFGSVIGTFIGIPIGLMLAKIFCWLWEKVGFHKDENGG